MSLLANFKRGQPVYFNALHPTAMLVAPPMDEAAKKAQRRKTWEMSPTFHCSLVGTCLTATELRQFFVRMGDRDAATATDHALHSRGVRAAGQHDAIGKLLNKALDRRHETVLKRFLKRTTAADVRASWMECLDRGEISGAYWAVMSHPAADLPLLQDVFAEVHMLSHLVGRSSRLDIARLRQLQAEAEAANGKIDRQERRLQAAADERITLQRRIENLAESLIHAEASRRRDAAALPADAAALHRETETARSALLMARLAETEAKLAAAEKRAAITLARNEELQQELDGLERLMLRQDDADMAEAPPVDCSRPVLYVGGRRHLFARLRTLAAGHGIALLLHDGGIEDNISLLPGLTGQAQAAIFPVDCISHAAVGMIKRLCQETETPFLPLRSASLASFVAAIEAL